MKRLTLAFVACTMMIAGCAEPPQIIETNTTVIDSTGIDSDGDGYVDYKGSLSAYAEERCQIAPSGAKEHCTSTLKGPLKGTGDCDDDPTDDPSHCPGLTPADCDPSAPAINFQCAVCINKNAPEIPGDGLDNNCDGNIDECSGDEQCNDGKSCTVDTCESQVCVNMPLPFGSVCDDGNLCVEYEGCDDEGNCMVGTEVVCEDYNPCTLNKCNGLGGCFYPFVADGQSCDDSNACTLLDSCMGGVCGGVPDTCDDNVACTVDSCHVVNGCLHTPDDTVCDDTNVCTVDTCDEVNGCANIDASLTICDDGVDCTTDACDPAAGCSNIPDNNYCSDGEYCTGVEICDPANDCQDGPDPVCDDNIACTIDTCDEVNDGCDFAPDHSVCDDGQACNGAETCDVLAGGCQPGTPVDPDDGVDCTVDTCVDPAGTIVNTPDDNLCDDFVGCTTDLCDIVIGCYAVENHASCQDGFFCNGPEVCDLAADCLPGTPETCDDFYSCTNDSCNEATDDCDYIPDNTDCDDSVDCTVDVCDPAVGDPLTGCVITPDDAACNDALYCNGVESCDLLAGCLPGNPPETDDAIPCTIDDCTEADHVTHTPDDSVCDDGLFCTGVETCSETLGCLDGEDPSTEDDINCTEDACDETNGITHTPNHTVCPLIGQVCDPDQVPLGEQSNGCFHPQCDPANDAGGEANGDCAVHRTNAEVPDDEPGAACQHYGYGCYPCSWDPNPPAGIGCESNLLGGICVAYEDCEGLAGETDENAPDDEAICDDGIDGDLMWDGKDTDDPGFCSGMCMPNCAGRVCGDDGCGGSCGACAVGELCNSMGQCEPGCVIDADCLLPGQVCELGHCYDPATQWINCWDDKVPTIASCHYNYEEGVYSCWSPPKWDGTQPVPQCLCWDGVQVLGGVAMGVPEPYPTQIECCVIDIIVSQSCDTHDDCDTDGGEVCIDNECRMTGCGAGQTSFVLMP